MEALPSSSVATAVSPELASAATGRVGKEGNALPAFAQVVQEALNRPTDSSNAPTPSVPSKASATRNPTDKVKKQRQSGRDEAQGAPDGLVAVNAGLLPFLLLALQVPNQGQQGPTDGSAPGAPGNIAVDNSGAEPGVNDAGPVSKSGLPELAAANGDDTSKENAALPTTASGVPAEQVQAQISDVLSAPLPPPRATADVDDPSATVGSVTPNSQTPSDPTADPTAEPAGDPQAKAPTLRKTELAPVVSDPLPSPPSPGAPSRPANSDTPLLVSPAHGTPTQAGSQSQQPEGTEQIGKAPLAPPSTPVSTPASAPPSAPSASGAPPPTQTGPQSQRPGGTEPVGNSTLAPLPVLGTKPPMITDSKSTPMGLRPQNGETQGAAPVQVSPSSPSGHGGSQDPSSNHKEPSRPDASSAASVAFPVSATHDATADPQSLVGGLPVKPDGSQAPATAATVVVSPPVATVDRAAVPVATPHQNAPTAAPAPLPSQEGAGVAASHFVNNAKLVEAAGHSEMRIAMETDKLGAVELRAHMVGDEVGAAITVEKRDAHAILAVELPALQQALSDKQFRIEQVTLLHGSFSSTTGDASGSMKQDQRGGPHATSRPWLADTGRISSAFGAGEQSGIFDSRGRLSVHA